MHARAASCRVSDIAAMPTFKRLSLFVFFFVNFVCFVVSCSFWVKGLTVEARPRAVPLVFDALLSGHP